MTTTAVQNGVKVEAPAILSTPGLGKQQLNALLKSLLGGVAARLTAAGKSGYSGSFAASFNAVNESGPPVYTGGASSAHPFIVVAEYPSVAHTPPWSYGRLPVWAERKAAESGKRASSVLYLAVRAIERRGTPGKQVMTKALAAEAVTFAGQLEAGVTALLEGKGK